MLFSAKKRLPSWRREVARPAIPHRVMHVDLKGPKIPVRVFADMLETFARWGLNGILVEYEHRLPELPLPHQFPARDRYTREELRSLTELAHSLGIEWIPLVQTFGHQEYLSRLKGTEFLFENPEYPNQLCPSSDKVRAYLKDLIDLVCELHPHSRKINVGQDETFFLGFCPACKKQMKAVGGKTEFWLDHARWVWSLVLDRGRQPMFWADMILNEGRLDLARELDPRVIPQAWDYNTIAAVSPHMIWKGLRPAKKKFRHPYYTEIEATPLPTFAAPGGFAEDLPKKELDRIDAMDTVAGYPKSFNQIRAMATTGRPLWGVSGVYVSSDMHFHPDFVRGTLNPGYMCALLADLKGQGVTGTSWARGHSWAPIGAPWPTTLYTIAQFAASAWTGKTAPEDLRARAGEIARELDMPERFGEWSLDDLLWTLSCGNTLVGVSGKMATIEQVTNLLRNSKVNGFFGDALKMSLECELLSQQFAYMAEESRWWYPNRQDLPACMIIGMKKRMGQHRRDIAALKIRAKQYYTPRVGGPHDFETWWKGAVEIHARVAECALGLLG